MTNGQIHIGSMSHETAIGILKLMLEAMETYDSISPTPERVNAVKMGIEALEQESNCSEIPTGSTTKDYLGVDYLGVDCISREQALRELKESAEHHANDSREETLLRRDRDIIRALPSITPQFSSGLDKNSKKLEKGTTKNDLGVDYLGVDCISRAQAQTEIEMNASRYTIAKERGGMGQVEWSDQLIKVSDAVDIIRHLSPVTPQEPKTGHWDDIPKYKDIAWQCSECGHFTTMKHNFCADCGCRMVEPQESEG